MITMTSTMTATNVMTTTTKIEMSRAAACS